MDYETTIYTPRDLPHDAFGGKFKMKIKRGLFTGKLKISKDGKRATVITARRWRQR